MAIRRIVVLMSLLVAFGTLFVAAPVAAEEFKIGVPPTQKDAAKKFAPLDAYLSKNGLSVKFVTYKDNDNAATMLAAGELDGIFSGSAVAAIMIEKKAAKPLLRPIDNLGRSTYWAVVLGPKGAPAFTERGDYFKGKKVAFCSMASSGEYYFLSLPGARNAGANTVTVPTHEVAIEMLSRGEVDFAIVKNTSWTAVKNKTPNVVEVGSDGEQNPNNTLLVSVKTAPGTLKKLLDALLFVGKDNSPEASAVKEGLGVKEYIITTDNDFKHTRELLSKAGVLK